ncbi:hypothetical protein SteCoe_19867 [Stentor coeruleus]|uniref:Uncharacterized protein n=1 Tax=Stentor coeruleus TaxID=5963 RepID=A0A1R2BTB9_9CILI|nr:hypothetical protein SteCoe_19867 [Stentor coeruleus]
MNNPQPVKPNKTQIPADPNPSVKSKINRLEIKYSELMNNFPTFLQSPSSSKHNSKNFPAERLNQKRGKSTDNANENQKLKRQNQILTKAIEELNSKIAAFEKTQNNHMAVGDLEKKLIAKNEMLDKQEQDLIRLKKEVEKSKYELQMTKSNNTERDKNSRVGSSHPSQKSKSPITQRFMPKNRDYSPMDRKLAVITVDNTVSPKDRENYSKKKQVRVLQEELEKTREERNLYKIWQKISAENPPLPPAVNSVINSYEFEIQKLISINKVFKSSLDKLIKNVRVYLNEAAKNITIRTNDSLESFKMKIFDTIQEVTQIKLEPNSLSPKKSDDNIKLMKLSSEFLHKENKTLGDILRREHSRANIFSDELQAKNQEVNELKQTLESFTNIDKHISSSAPVTSERFFDSKNIDLGNMAFEFSLRNIGKLSECADDKSEFQSFEGVVNEKMAVMMEKIGSYQGKIAKIVGNTKKIKQKIVSLKKSKRETEIFQNDLIEIGMENEKLKQNVKKIEQELNKSIQENRNLEENIQIITREFNEYRENVNRKQEVLGKIGSKVSKGREEGELQEKIKKIEDVNRKISEKSLRLEKKIAEYEGNIEEYKKKVSKTEEMWNETKEKLMKTEVNLRQTMEKLLLSEGKNKELKEKNESEMKIVSDLAWKNKEMMGKIKENEDNALKYEEILLKTQEKLLEKEEALGKIKENLMESNKNNKVLDEKVRDLEEKLNQAERKGDKYAQSLLEAQKNVSFSDQKLEEKEKIIGELKKSQEKVNELQEKVNKYMKNIMENEQIVKRKDAEVEKYKEVLEGKIDEIKEKNQEIQNNKKIIEEKSDEIKRKDQELENNKKNIDEISNKNHKIQEYKEKIDSLQSQLDQSTNISKDLQSKFFEQSALLKSKENKILSLTSNIESLHETLKSSQNSIETLKLNLENTQKETEKSKQSYSDLQQELSNKNHELESFKKSITKTENDYNKAIKELNLSQETNSKFLADIENLQSTLSLTEQESKENIKKLKTLEESNKNLTTTTENLNKNNKILEEKLKTSQEALTKSETQCQDLLENIKTSQANEEKVKHLEQLLQSSNQNDIKSSEQIKTLYSKLLQNEKKLADMNSKYIESEKTIGKLYEKIADYDKNLVRSQSKLTELQKLYNDLQQKYDDLNEKNEDLKENYSKTESDLMNSKSYIEECEEKIYRLEETIKNLSMQEINIGNQENIKKTEEKLARTEERLVETLSAVDKFEKQYQGIKDHDDNIENKKMKHGFSIDFEASIEIISKFPDLHEKYAKFIRFFEVIKENVVIKEVCVDNPNWFVGIYKENVELKDEVGKKSLEVSEKNKVIEDMGSDLDGKILRIKKSADEEMGLRKELMRMKEEIEEKKAEIEKWEQKHNSLINENSETIENFQSITLTYQKSANEILNFQNKIAEQEKITKILKNNIDDLTKEINSLEEKADSDKRNYENDLEISKSYCKRLESLNSSLEKTISQQDFRFKRSLQEKEDEYNSSLSSLHSEISSLQTEISNNKSLLEKQKQLFESEIDLKNSQINTLTFQISSLETFKLNKGTLTICLEFCETIIQYPKDIDMSPKHSSNDSRNLIPTPQGIDESEDYPEILLGGLYHRRTKARPGTPPIISLPQNLDILINNLLRQVDENISQQVPEYVIDWCKKILGNENYILRYQDSGSVMSEESKSNYDDISVVSEMNSQDMNYKAHSKLTQQKKIIESLMNKLRDKKERAKLNKLNIKTLQIEIRKLDSQIKNNSRLDIEYLKVSISNLTKTLKKIDKDSMTMLQIIYSQLGMNTEEITPKEEKKRWGLFAKKKE